MSIYIMTLGELARKHNRNYTEFTNQLKEGGNLSFEIRSNLQKLTQGQVDEVMNLIYPSQSITQGEVTTTEVSDKIQIENPNVAIFKRVDGAFLIHLIEGKMDEKGLVTYNIRQTYLRDTRLGALVVYDNLIFKYDIESAVD